MQSPRATRNMHDRTQRGLVYFRHLLKTPNPPKSTGRSFAGIWHEEKEWREKNEHAKVLVFEQFVFCEEISWLIHLVELFFSAWQVCIALGKGRNERSRTYLTNAQKPLVLCADLPVWVNKSINEENHATNCRQGVRQRVLRDKNNCLHLMRPRERTMPVAA